MTAGPMIDMRRAVDRLPWPNIRGKRCLDVARPDQHLTAELEERGAVEVVAVDLDGCDLDLEGIGPFDVVVASGVLRHLRDPLRGLEALRRATRGVLLSSEPVDLVTTIVGRGRPMFRLPASGGEWFAFNAAAHRRFLDVAGFDVHRASGVFTVPFRDAPPPPTALGVRGRARLQQLVTRSAEAGVVHRALLARVRDA